MYLLADLHMISLNYINDLNKYSHLSVTNLRIGSSEPPSADIQKNKNSSVVALKLSYFKICEML